MTVSLLSRSCTKGRSFRSRGRSFKVSLMGKSERKRFSVARGLNGAPHPPLRNPPAAPASPCRAAGPEVEESLAFRVEAEEAQHPLTLDVGDRKVAADQLVVHHAPVHQSHRAPG